MKIKNTTICPRVVLVSPEGRFCDNCGMANRSPNLTTCPDCCLWLSLVSELTALGKSLDRLKLDCICSYCGNPATDVEHVIPKHTGFPTYTVPACQECNMLAGSQIFDSFGEKQAAIRSKLRLRHRKILSAEQWTEEEINELGYSLATAVRAMIAARLELEARLAFSPTSY